MKTNKEKSSTFHFSADTHELIAELVSVLEKKQGMKIAKTNLLRLALYRLAQAEGIRD